MEKTMETKLNLSDYNSTHLQNWLRANLVDGQIAKRNSNLSTKFYNIDKKMWIDIFHNTNVSQVEFVPSAFWVIIPTTEQIEKYISDYCTNNELVWSYVLRGMNQRVLEIYNSDLQLVYSTSMYTNEENIKIQKSRILALKWIYSQIQKTKYSLQTKIAV